MILNKLVKEELSGRIAKSYVAQISGFHRIQASPMFHEAAEYVKNELLKLGLKDATIERFPADGSHKYWTYTSPISWEVKSAKLSLAEPEKRLIVSYEDLPQCLHTFSNGTPRRGVVAELVDVGSGIKPADYEGKDVKGKFVLATGRAKLVHEQAVYKRGAAGVMTDTLTYEMPDTRESLDVPDAHAYQGIWPTRKVLPKLAFGFSLSKRQGNRLRALLKDEKTVKLKAEVDARLFSGSEEVVTATIPGESKPDEEIFLIAHLCHPKPSANDNASGSGLLLEIARTIKRLIATHKFRSPMRTIRFMWVPETYGSVAYLSRHRDSPSRLVAGINLDMVGQDQEKCRSTLNLDCTPDSLPSYLNDYVFSLIEQSVKEFDPETVFGSSSTFRYRMNPFSGGSDHAEFTEASIGVPCIMLLQWPDLYYHTSMDTIDKVSENSLKRIGWVVTIAALMLANATASDTFALAHQAYSRGVARLVGTSGEAVETLFKMREDFKNKAKIDEATKELAKIALYYKHKIRHVAWRERQAITSVKRLGEDCELDALLDKYCKRVADLGRQKDAEFEDALTLFAKISGITIPTKLDDKASEELKRMTPKRLFKGTLSGELLKENLGDKEYEWYQEVDEKDMDFKKKMAEILNFMDGRRNAYDIANSVSAEYSRTAPKHVLKFLRDLEKAKLAEIKRR